MIAPSCQGLPAPASDAPRWPVSLCRKGPARLPSESAALCDSYGRRFWQAWRATMPVQIPRPAVEVETMRAALAALYLGGVEGPRAFVDFLRPIVDREAGC